MNNLESKIEAILFFKGEPVALKKLGELLKVSPGELLEGMVALKNSLASRGIALMEKDGEVTLGTAPEHTALIENLRKEELNRDLSKASLEVLSIVLYKNGASRSLIDYIRGVNSSFTLRALSVRGLCERIVDATDSRRYIYRPSFELLSFMGVKSVEELPDYAEISATINMSEVDLEKEQAESNEN